ncbi:hypothetical protein RhiXN_08379 [Rhizoctonia solani]|uniref:Uncharacterized protein n=1 Tax=Rhizoctonia solani TaxID=456999 RepID=A0A8H8P2D0_9AGAM|nr:uncharacterized protein RhiXN_08379 [Rhizoctonia solani]QRW23343.1 hypothetical protein RhiXN_08379 [Rhizoctonia solani]
MANALRAFMMSILRPIIWCIHRLPHRGRLQPEHARRIRNGDVEQALGPHLLSRTPLLSAGTTLELKDFIRDLKLTTNSSTVGKLIISRFQLRKSKRLPFRHEYVVLFVESKGVEYIIRIDRLGNLGSLTKGVRWHMGSFGIGGYSKDCVHIEEASSELGRLLKEDPAGSNILADLHHWSSVIQIKEDCVDLRKAAANLLNEINYKMQCSERYLLQQIIDLYDISSNPSFGLIASNQARFRAFEKATLKKLPDSIPDLLMQYFRVYSRRRIGLHDTALRGSFALLGLNESKNTKWRDPISHYRVLSAVSRYPLTLLDLSHRLEVLSKAWPAYNLITTNCNLIVMYLSALKLAGTRFLKSALKHDAEFSASITSSPSSEEHKPRPRRSLSTGGLPAEIQLGAEKDNFLPIPTSQDRQHDRKRAYSITCV